METVKEKHAKAKNAKNASVNLVDQRLQEAAIRQALQQYCDVAVANVEPTK